MCLHGTDRNITSAVCYSTLQDKYNNSSECIEITANSTKTCNKVTTTMKSNLKNSHLQCSNLLYNKKKKNRETRNEMKMFQIIKPMRHVKLKSIPILWQCRRYTHLYIWHSKHTGRDLPRTAYLKVSIHSLQHNLKTVYPAAIPSKQNQRAAIQFLRIKGCQAAE